jgi:hypothetical protein
MLVIILYSDIKIKAVTAFFCPINWTLNAKIREKARKTEKTRAFARLEFV